MDNNNDSSFNYIVVILSIISIALSFVCFGPKIYMCLQRICCLNPGRSSNRSRQNVRVGFEETEEIGQKNGTGRVLFRVTDSQLEGIS